MKIFEVFTKMKWLDIIFPLCINFPLPSDYINRARESNLADHQLDMLCNYLAIYVNEYQLDLL